MDNYWINFAVGATAILTLAMHLVCVNIAATGPLACIWLEIRAQRRGDPPSGELGRWLARFCCKIFLVGMVLGLLNVALVWLRGERFFDGLGRVPTSRIYWGVAELGFYYLCMIPYVLMWNGSARWRYFHRLLAIAAATNLMYHFWPLFVIIAKLAGESSTAALDSAEFRSLLVDPQVLSQVTHHFLASVALVGVAMSVRAETVTRVSRQDLARLIRQGAWLALSATLLQIPVGIWVLLSFPAASRDRLMGGGWWATAMFVGAMIAAVALMYRLAVVALGETDRRSVRSSAALMFLVILLMVGALRF